MVTIPKKEKKERDKKAAMTTTVLNAMSAMRCCHGFNIFFIAYEMAIKPVAEKSWICIAVRGRSGNGT